MKTLERNNVEHQRVNLAYLKRGVRVVSSVGLFVFSVFSPIGSPIQSRVYATEEQCQDIAGLTPLAGNCDPSDVNFGIILEPKSGATVDMARRLAEQGFRNLPVDIQNGSSIYLVDSRLIVGDFGCDLDKGYCSNYTAAIIATVDNINRGAGRIIHEPALLVKSKYAWEGSVYADLETSIPSVYTGSMLILMDPSPPRDENLLNWMYARSFIHENIGHGLAGIPDNDGVEKDVMHHYFNTLAFSPQHLQIIRNRLSVGLHRYRVPPTTVELRNTSSQLVARMLQLNQMSLVLGVDVPLGTTQFLSEVVPYNNDGPGVSDYIYGSSGIQAWRDAGRIVPPPPQWYGLLPDMTYTWKVRTSGVAEPIADKDGRIIIDDPRWGKIQTDPGVFIYVPEAEATKTFRTPKKFADKIMGDAVSLVDGGIRFRWQNPDPEVFYYEVQVSKDLTFNMDPQTATAAVYWNLVHGGITNNTWELPSNLREEGVRYYARVRPRVQGDGTPVPWSQNFEFTTPATVN